MKLQVYIVESGSGKTFNAYDPVGSLDEATKLVQQMEREFQEWLEVGDMKVKVPEWMRHYEGSDIYAKDLETTDVYAETGHGEEEIGWERI